MLLVPRRLKDKPVQGCVFDPFSLRDARGDGTETEAGAVYCSVDGGRRGEQRALADDGMQTRERL